MEFEVKYKAYSETGSVILEFKGDWFSDEWTKDMNNSKKLFEDQICYSVTIVNGTIEEVLVYHKVKND